MVWSWLVFACASGPAAADAEICRQNDGLLPCEVAEACYELDTGGDRIDCRQSLSAPDSCPEQWEVGSGGITQAGFVYQGELNDWASSQASVYTITDEATWNTFVEQNAFTPVNALVDWSANLVVVVQYSVNSTCGMGLQRHGIRYVEGYETYPAVVYAEWKDSTGSCGDVCDMERSSAVIYQVTRASGWPIVCASVLNTCE